MYKDFYKQGIASIPFGNEKLNNVLFDIANKNLKPGFSLASKYNKTLDLRPDVISYSSVFIDALKEFNIPEIIKQLTLKDMSLFHIQVRIASNEESYMNWHRDTYYDYDGNLRGKAPHPVKLIYYPRFDEEEKDRLLYLLGSNRIVFPNNNYDKQLFNLLKVKKVKSSNEKGILFDTNGMHAVCPETKNNSSIRLIYGFLASQQIIDDHSDDSLHMKTMSLYDKIK